MIENLRKRVLAAPAWLPLVLAALAAPVYILIANQGIHTVSPGVDEGMYQVKGWWFASGRYFPYEDYGPWTNHMPLSFLMHGYIQTLFGPGMGADRYAMLALSLSGMLALWLTVRHLRSEWWAAAAVWAVTLNPAWVKTYSLGIAQPLVGNLLMWLLFAILVLPGRRGWLLAGFLGGVLAMTRLNAAPILALLVLYVYWQHGKRPAIETALMGGAVILIVIAPFWPNILKFLSRWLPESLFPTVIETWYVNLGDPGSKTTDLRLFDRILAFTQGMRFSFTAVVGGFLTLLLWPRRSAWEDPTQYRQSVFVAGLFLILYLSHTITPMMGRGCDFFCYVFYLMFFHMVGILLLAMMIPQWLKTSAPIRTWLAVALILLLGLGIGFSAHGTVGNALLDMHIPWVSGGQLSFDEFSLGTILANKYNRELSDLREIVPTVAGGLAAVGILAAAGLWQRADQRAKKPGYAWRLATLTMCAGLILSPTQLLGAGLLNDPCQDIVAAYEAAGERLDEVIPAGSQVYWYYRSAIPLLHATEFDVYPSQLNLSFSLRNVDTQEKQERAERYGFWTQNNKIEWSIESDYLIVEDNLYRYEWADKVEQAQYIVIEQIPVEKCRQTNASLYVLEPVRRNLP